MAVSRNNVSGSYSQIRLRPCKTSSSRSGQKDPAFRARIGRAFKRSIRIASLSVLAIATIGFSGCCFILGGSKGKIDEFMDNQVTCMRDYVWPRRAFYLRYGHCDWQYADHFRDGFVAGYGDVIKGGSGESPAMPPDRYWGLNYQTQEGAEMQRTWFAGFEAGSAAALEDGIGMYRDVQLSLEYQKILGLDESIGNKHGGVRSDVMVENSVVHTNPADRQNSFNFESESKMAAPMANTPMAIPQDSWQPPSNTINTQQPLPMQIVPSDVLNDDPVSTVPTQR